MKTPYVSGTGNSAVASGTNGLSVKTFLLSGFEVGWTRSLFLYIPKDGACLSYFNGTSATDSKRIAKFNGEANYWLLRSSDIDTTDSIIFVHPSGGISEDLCVTTRGVRPALIMPSDTKLSEDGTISYKGVYIKQSGAWSPTKSVWIKQAGAWSKV